MKKWRINLVFILIILFGVFVVCRLVQLQIIKYDFYKALAQGQQGIFYPQECKRGEIFFSNGQILAKNAEGKYLFASPKEMGDKEKAADILSGILEIDKESLLEKFNRDSLFELLKDDLTKQELELLEKVNLPGISLKETVLRKYPQEFMASQVIGFLGGEGRGQYGVEGYYDDILQGKEGFLKCQRGADIFLTIDYNIQFMTEKMLEQAKENLNIEAGQIIVMEPNSGKILALANFPNFNPNSYSEVEDFQIFQNGVIQKLYEPGSVFKAVTMASALDREKITPQTTYVDEGKVKIGEDTIYNYNERVFGKMSMIGVLERSINTGAVFAEKQAGHNAFLEYIKKFGFFESTGIDLYGEIFSENKEFRKGYEINFATASFGQGIEITPLQMARAFSVIASGGKLFKPYITEKIIKADGSIKEISPELSAERIISPKTASQLTAMLVSVTENGFAKEAKIPGYYIAGKTGTSQVSWSSIGVNKEGYSENTWQSFIGFAPAFDARFLILIKLDNPETKTAEYSAVPIFRELAKYVIDYMQIPPDYSE